MKARKRSLICLPLIAAMFVTSLFSAGAAIAAEVSEVTDDAASGVTVTQDAYGISYQESDVGFGVDSRYITVKAPTAAPDASTMWNEEYAYLQYAVAGQNVMEVYVDCPPDMTDALDAPLCYADPGPSGAAVALYTKSAETSQNWSRVKYTYMLPASVSSVRIVFTAYNDEGTGMATWMQQITKVRLYYAETPPEVPEYEFYKDECDGNAVSGQRSDVFNLSVLSDKAPVVGDAARIIFGENPGAAESYIDYSIGYGQDTVAVVCYEEIKENDARPDGLAPVKFSVLTKNWEVAATGSAVLLDGSYAENRWSVVVYYYEFPEGVSEGTLRVHIYKQAAGLEESLQIGEVWLFGRNEENAGKLEAKLLLDNNLCFLDSTLYSETNWAQVESAYNTGCQAVDAAETQDDIDDAFDIAISDMGAVKTLAEVAAEALSEYKDTLKAQLDTYAAGKTEADYNEENWAAVQTAVTDGKAAIDAADSESAADSALAAAKEAIDAVEKRGSGQSGGCNSTASAASGALFLFVLGGAFIIAGKKRHAKKTGAD